MSKTNEPIFSVIFKKGLADRNRLPLDHVITTLQELDRMIRDVGKQIQREKGVENPDGDFGIQLVAGTSGIAFGKGSIKTQSALTKDVDNGLLAIMRVIETTDILEKKKVASVGTNEEPLYRRLETISNIQEKDHTELSLALANEGRVLKKAKYSQTGIEALRRMSAAEFGIESVTVFGKLKAVRDLSKEDADSNWFWGELIEDNGYAWRVKFKNSDLGIVLPLFKKQVVIQGDATYFKTKAPRLDAKRAVLDTERDYLSAFDALRDAYQDILGDRNPDEIIEDMRG